MIRAEAKVNLFLHCQLIKFLMFTVTWMNDDFCSVMGKIFALLVNTTRFKELLPEGDTLIHIRG